MSVSTIPSTCPACGTAKSVFAIFIRSDLYADLVCETCREATDAAGPCDGASDGGSVALPPNARPSSRRHLFRRVS